MKRTALTICVALGLLTGPVWASTSAVGARTGEVTASSPTEGKPGARVASEVRPQSVTPSYAAREAANPELTRFKGGNASIYIGGSTVVIVLLVVLLIVLL